MRILIPRLERQIACCVVALLMTPLGETATLPLLSAPQAAEGAAMTQPQANARTTNETDSSATQPGEAPGGPGSAPAQSGGEQTAPPASSVNQPGAAPPAVGTAAAPYIKPEGVLASRPAGAAIAPAKQKRTRSFAIRIGLLVGAGIAIGMVTAASLNSSSRPH